MNDLFSKKTVFIMGAGAHVPYGFPSGGQLRNNIINFTLEERQRMLTWYKEEVDGYATIDFVERFIQEFNDSGVPSIDRFLSDNRKYDFVGRCAIALALVKYEDKGLIERHKKNSGDDWYDILLKHIDDSKRNFPSEAYFPAFITFNYDRYFDYRLFNYCKHCWIKSSDGRTLTDEEIYDFLRRNFKIYHVFGQLDYMPGEVKGVEGRAFSHEFGANGPKGAIEGLKTTYLDWSNDQDFQMHIQSIRDEIQKAERLVFMGFGFDDFNFKLILGTQEIFKSFEGKKVTDVYITNIGLGSGLQGRMSQFFNNAKGKIYSDLGQCLIKNPIESKKFNCSELLNDI